MIPCLLFLGAVLSCPERSVEPGVPPVPAFAALQDTARVEDPWVGEDKLQHLALSFAATTFAYGGGRFVLDPTPAAWASAGVALSLGLAKEIVDHRAGRGFSLKDLAWDAAGVAVALTLADGIR